MGSRYICTYYNKHVLIVEVPNADEITRVRADENDESLTD